MEIIASFQDQPLFLSKTHTKKLQIYCFASFYLWHRFLGGSLECNLVGHVVNLDHKHWETDLNIINTPYS